MLSDEKSSSNLGKRVSDADDCADVPDALNTSLSSLEAADGERVSLVIDICSRFV